MKLTFKQQVTYHKSKALLEICLKETERDKKELFRL
jgi:hypothetical protein